MGGAPPGPGPQMTLGNIRSQMRPFQACLSHSSHVWLDPWSLGEGIGDLGTVPSPLQEKGRATSTGLCLLGDLPHSKGLP